MISRNSATASSEPDRASARSDSSRPGRVVQVAQLRRPAEQVQGQRQVGVGPGAARPALLGGRQAVAQQPPAADQPVAAGRAAPEPGDGGLGVVAQPAAELRPPRAARPAPSWRTGRRSCGRRARTIRIASTSLLQDPSAIWRTSSRSTASRGRKSRANSASRRSTSAAASGGRTMPLPVSPSLQPLRRLRSLPSGVTGPRDSRPLARLASARAVLGLALGCRDDVDGFGERGGHRRLLIEVQQGCCRVEGPLRPGAYPGLVAG